MRLLDLVRQCDTDVRLPTPAGEHRLPSPPDFHRALETCPLRLVLDDALTRLCAELACSEGDRLGRCLDLIRLPARRLWVEWNDAARADFRCDLESRGRAGLLVEADASGRRAVVRTFFTEERDVRVAAMTTHVDLDDAVPPCQGDPFDGGDIPVSADDEGLAPLMDRVWFRFDPAWANYYRLQPDRDTRRRILHGCLGAVARDMPVLFALLLLMSTREGLPQSAVDRSRLNAARRRRGKIPLLDHLEVSAPVFGHVGAVAGGDGASARHMLRLHHVRGHLVRRSDTIFWRRAHLRGDPRAGTVQSRTVTLYFRGGQEARL